MLRLPVSMTEIEAALPTLTDEELIKITRAVKRIYRERHNRNVYDDAYGRESEADLIAAADAAFLIYDREEEKNAKPRPR